MNKIFSVFLLVVLVASITIFINGCEQITPTGSSTGSLKLQVTDKPDELNITEAFVTVSNIQVHKALANESENATTEESWFTVINETKTFDLVAIQGQKMDLGTETLGVGRYTQVRLQVIDAKIKINGTEYNLTVPSEKIKLIKGFNIEENKTTTLTLDFNLNESVIKAGEKYNFKPTIKIIQE